MFLVPALSCLHDLTLRGAGLLTQGNPGQSAIASTSVVSGAVTQWTPILSSAAAPHEPHVAIPESYSWEAGRCSSFLLQCSLVFDLQPLTYLNNKSKIAFILNLLSGRILQWVSAIIENQTLASTHYSSFTAVLRHAFDHSAQISETVSKLLSLHQGASTMADCAIHFRMLVANGGWRISRLGSSL